MEWGKAEEKVKEILSDLVSVTPKQETKGKKGKGVIRTGRCKKQKQPGSNPFLLKLTMYSLQNMA